MYQLGTFRVPPRIREVVSGPPFSQAKRLEYPLDAQWPALGYKAQGALERWMHPNGSILTAPSPWLVAFSDTFPASREREPLSGQQGGTWVFQALLVLTSLGILLIELLKILDGRRHLQCGGVLKTHLGAVGGTFGATPADRPSSNPPKGRGWTSASVSLTAPDSSMGSNEVARNGGPPVSLSRVFVD